MAPSNVKAAAGHYHSAPMDPEQQLQYEARVRNRQAIIAVLAGVFVLLASILQLIGPHTKLAGYAAAIASHPVAQKVTAEMQAGMAAMRG